MTTQTATTPKPTFVNVATLCKELGVARASVTNYIGLPVNPMPHMKVGRNPIFNLEEARAWHAAYTEKTKAASRERGRKMMTEIINAGKHSSQARTGGQPGETLTQVVTAIAALQREVKELTHCVTDLSRQVQAHGNLLQEVGQGVISNLGQNDTDIMAEVGQMHLKVDKLCAELGITNVVVGEQPQSLSGRTA